MQEPPPSRWRWPRRIFRWFRILLLALVCLAAAGLLYLNRVGVPRFVREMAETELRSRGLDARLGPVRVRGFRELAAGEIRLASVGQPHRAHLEIRGASLLLDPDALRRLELRVQSVSIDHGRISWPLDATAGRSLDLEDVHATLELPGRDLWRLTRLDGRFLGAQMRMSATLTNASSLRRSGRAGTPVLTPADWLDHIDRLAVRLDRLRFSDDSSLTLQLAADAKIPSTLRGLLTVRAPVFKAGSSTFSALELTARIGPDHATNGNTRMVIDGELGSMEVARTAWNIRQAAIHMEAEADLKTASIGPAQVRLTADAAASPWVSGGALQLEGSTHPLPGDTNGRFATALQWSMENGTAAQGRWRSARGETRVSHFLDRAAELQGEFGLEAGGIDSPWVSSEKFSARGTLGATHWRNGPGSDPALGPWAALVPLTLDLVIDAGRTTSTNLVLDALSLQAHWHFPMLRLSRFESRLHGGRFAASADLNVETRQVAAQTDFQFDVHQVESLLTPDGRRWLQRFTWTNDPPKVSATASVTLPAWTNRHPDWRGEVRPTLVLAGRFEAGAGAFRGVPALGARSRFFFTNQVWLLPDLAVTRPEGRVELAHSWDMRTKDYWWRIDSTINPEALVPLLEEPQRRGLSQAGFSDPPRIQGEVWGRWDQPESVGVRGVVAATNLVIRGESFDAAQTRLHYTNGVLRLEEPSVRRGGETAFAPLVVYDHADRLLRVEQAESTLDPARVARMIGPETRRVLDPYRFARPPRVTVHGAIPTQADATNANVRFTVRGRDFSYWRFRTDEVTGDLHWQGRSLVITNLTAGFYGGLLGWSGTFDFDDDENARFGFRARFQNTDLAALMKDLHSSTNHLEGRLDGNLVITDAHSADRTTWQGYGNARITDGSLWNIPIFGFVSSLLDKVAPELGRSQATAASATFTINQGVIDTPDLEVRAPALRLHYTGTVDLHGNLNASVEAEPLRDAWAVGRVVSFALSPLSKIFAYKLTGTLSDPQTQPLYIPRLLLLPFRPFQALQNLFSGDKEEKRDPTPPPP